MKLKLLFLSLFICIAGMSQDFIMKRKLADSYFNNFDFYKAAPMYEQLLMNRPDDRQLYEKLALLYDHLNDSRNAERCYAFLVKDKDHQPSDLLNYARSLARNGKYELSRTWYRSFQSVRPDDPRGAWFADAYQDISAFFRDSASFKIVRAPFSSPADEFSPAFFGKSIVFASDRSKSTMVRSTYNWTNSSFLDLYVAEPASGDAHPFARELNSIYHEGPVCFNRTQDTIFLTRSKYFNSTLNKSKEGVNKLGIFQANWDSRKKQWINLAPLNLTDNEFSAEHPALSPGGDMLYFASDMPGGMGGMDLYACIRERGSDGRISWSAPVNLGPGINSPGNEVFPFLDGNGNLWYASDGIPGLGGLDIFFAGRSAKGFSKAINPGYPMNTRFDDFGYITQNEGEDGFFSSNRFNTGANDDIFSISRTFRELKLRVTDSATRKDLSQVHIGVTPENDKPTEIMKENYSPVVIRVNPFKSYTLAFSKQDYLPASLVFPGEGLTVKDTVKISLTSRKAVCKLVGKVISGSQSAVANVVVHMDGGSTASTADLVTDAGGSFTAELNPGELYRFRVSQPAGGKCHGETVEVSTRGIRRDSTLLVTIPWYCIGDIVRLRDIHYDLNNYGIRPDAAVMLDKLVILMNEYPGMRIELRSHTDSRGSVGSNRTLSENRVKSAKEYLCAKGINRIRISGKGYGETMLLNKCKKGVTCSEAEHQENRRTEFKILKWE